MSASTSRLPFAALLAGATGIGFAPLFVRLSEVGPSMTAAYRVLLALPFLWTWMRWEQRGADSSPQPANAREFGALAVAGVFFVADLVLWHWSLQLTTVANSTLLTNFAPVFVAVAARLFLGERFTPAFLLGMTLAVAGAVLLVGRSFQLTRQHLLGDALSLLTALFYAGYLLSVKLLRRRYSIATIMAWSGLVSALGFAMIGWLSGERMMPASASGWLVLALLALVCHVAGQCLIGYGLGHLAASFSAVSLLWQPVVAAALAWAVLGEPLGLLQVAGGSVILLGIATAGGTWTAIARPVDKIRP
jgi:drug/metabolite transporter (DMT)-like permease